VSDPLAEAEKRLAETIARQQVHAFAVLLADEVSMQLPASGAVTQRDLWRAITNATRRYAAERAS
jgi:hypothetical protein